MEELQSISKILYLLVAVMFLLLFLARVTLPVYRYSRATKLPESVVRKAQRGNIDASAEVGLALLRVRKNKAARQFLQRAATSEHPAVIKALVEHELNRKQPGYARALNWAELLVDRTDGNQWRLKVYRAMPPSLLLSRYSSDLEDPALRFALAQVYLGQKEYVLAKQLFEQSISDFPSAHIGLAELYQHGLETPKDVRTAFLHYQSALDADCEDALGKYRNFVASLELEELLLVADPEERHTLAELLGMGGNTGARDIAHTLGRKAGNTVANLARRGRGVSYIESLNDSLKHLEVAYPRTATMVQREELLIREHFTKLVDELDEEQKKQFTEELREKAQALGKDYAGVGVTGAGALGIAISGFAPYLMATTTMSTISGAVGVTLPFAAYTTLTSTMSIFAGPVGLIGIATWAAVKMGRPDSQKVLAAVLGVASIRQRILIGEDA